MENNYYDAHIKTHERYLLIQLFESDKSERIQQLAKTVAMPEEKVHIPEPEIVIQELPYKQHIETYPFDTIQIQQSENIDFMPSIDERNFNDIPILNTDIPDNTTVFEPNIRFEDVHLMEISLPKTAEKMNIAFDNIHIHRTTFPAVSENLKMEVNIGEFNDMALQEIAVPKNTKHIDVSFEQIQIAVTKVAVPTMTSEIKAVPQNFSDISLSDISVPEHTTMELQNQAFSVPMKSVILPKQTNLSETLFITEQIDIPIAENICTGKMPADFSVNIMPFTDVCPEMPVHTAPVSIHLDMDKFPDIPLKTIAVPETADCAIYIDTETLSDISVETAAVPERTENLNVHTDTFSLQIGKTVLETVRKPGKIV